MKSAKFLGYDPGGMGNNGVAVAEIAEDGSFLHEFTQDCDVVRDVYEWLKLNSSGAVALGIDTLLAWSIDASRTCDDELRNKYREKCRNEKGRVLQQASIWGSVAIHGVLVAKEAQRMEIPIFESHPTLLVCAIKGVDEQSENLLRAYNNKKSPHQADALVAAWCASRWCFGKWKEDLYLKTGQKGLHFPAGEAVYPWPESLD